MQIFGHLTTPIAPLRTHRHSTVEQLTSFLIKFCTLARTHTHMAARKKSVGNLTVAYHFRFRQAPHDAVSTGQKKKE